ncbi:MAG TPA: DUF308 domain-containing protein [Micromonosporaceae bacterium]
MSAEGARRGRRHNGLDATEYVPAGDVDPRVGEHLLDVLAAAGIAAYLQPSADQHPITRATTIPSRPTDRLYVDRAHLATARDYLAQLADEVTDAPAPVRDPDLEARWQQIVAAYHDRPTGGDRPWPKAEDLDDERDGRPALTDEPAGRRLRYAADLTQISPWRAPDQPSLLDGLDTFGADLPDEPEEGYTPPPPPPLPRPSKYTVVAVLAIIVGFALFLFPTLLPVARGTVTLIGFACIIGGFVTLIWRMRPGDEDDGYDPDNGARV